MSLPKATTPIYSSSPSKSSLKSTQKAPSTSRNLLPSPHFEEPLPVHTSPRHSPRAQELSYEEEAVESAEASAQLPSLPFQPFFTLIEDSLTNEHHHPTVHYVFADDDADLITEAACRSLLRDDATQTYAPYAEESEAGLSNTSDAIREHYLLLDLAPTTRTDGAAAYEVTSAQSLSSEWQVLGTSVGAAPTINVEDDEAGLMLKIEGRGHTPDGIRKGKEEKKSMEEMIRRFEKGLSDIRKVIDAGTSTLPEQDKLE